jgi:hypothetical protein
MTKICYDHSNLKQNKKMQNNSSEQTPQPNDTSAEQARFALNQRRLNYQKENISTSIDEVYETGDTQGGLALERARTLLDQQGTAEGEVFSAAQRQIESTLGPDGVWTDDVREAAVRLNREQRRNDGEQPISFEQALDEMKEYQTTTKEAARRDKDEWLDNEANALGYSLNGAKRGDPEGVESMLKYVEGMLGSAMSLSDEVRGASELRTLRDALFTEKQRIIQANAQEAKQQEAQVVKDAEVVTARTGVEGAFNNEAEPIEIQEAETPHEQDQVATLNTHQEAEKSAVVDARTELETVLANAPVEEAPVQAVEDVKDQETARSPTVIPEQKEVTPSQSNEQSQEARQEAAQKQRLRQAQSFIGQYFNGASAQTMRGIVGKLSAEMKEKPEDIYKRFQSGDIAVDRQTEILLSQLNQQGYKPNSAGWGNRNPNSLEGKVAVQSGQALEQILRRMLAQS